MKSCLGNGVALLLFGGMSVLLIMLWIITQTSR